jgi:hypothetical protein
MKVIEEAEAQERLDAILDEVQQRRIIIRRQGKDGFMCCRSQRLHVSLHEFLGPAGDRVCLEIIDLTRQ